MKKTTIEIDKELIKKALKFGKKNDGISTTVGIIRKALIEYIKNWEAKDE